MRWGKNGAHCIRSEHPTLHSAPLNFGALLWLRLIQMYARCTIRAVQSFFSTPSRTPAFHSVSPSSSKCCTVASTSKRLKRLKLSFIFDLSNSRTRWIKTSEINIRYRGPMSLSIRVHHNASSQRIFMWSFNTSRSSSFMSSFSEENDSEMPPELEEVCMSELSIWSVIEHPSWTATVT
jgi:hypothetical protein